MLMSHAVEMTVVPPIETSDSSDEVLTSESRRHKVYIARDGTEMVYASVGRKADTNS
jgi:hypothetical protein